MFPVPSELVFTYRMGDLPEALTGPVDTASPVRRCAFYVAARGSPSLRQAFAALPEPDLEEVPRWMGISRQVATALRQARALVELEDGTPNQIFSMGFHTGDGEAFLAALREGGAEVRDVGPTLRALVWLECWLPQLYERCVRPTEVFLSDITPVRAPTYEQPGLYARTRPGDDILSWAVFGEQGQRADLDDVGAVALLEPIPAQLPPVPIDARALDEARAILSEVWAQVWTTGSMDVRVALHEAGPGYCRVEVFTDLDGEPFSVESHPIAILPDDWPFDPARYRACVQGVRAARSAVASPLLPSEVVAHALLHDEALQTPDDFARAWSDPVSTACAIARRDAAAWRARGVDGPVDELHGYLSPRWLKEGDRFGWDGFALVEVQREGLSRRSEDEARRLRRVAAVRWLELLLADHLEIWAGSIANLVYLGLWYEDREGVADAAAEVIAARFGPVKTDGAAG